MKRAELISFLTERGTASVKDIAAHFGISRQSAQDSARRALNAKAIHVAAIGEQRLWFFAAGRGENVTHIALREKLIALCKEKPRTPIELSQLTGNSLSYTRKELWRAVDDGVIARRGRLYAVGEVIIAPTAPVKILSFLGLLNGG
jgi:hypothetical protein